MRGRLHSDYVAFALLGAAAAFSGTSIAMTSSFEGLEPLPEDERVCVDIPVTSLDRFAGQLTLIRWKKAAYILSASDQRLLVHPDRNAAGISCEVSFYDDPVDLGDRDPMRYFLSYAGPEEVSFLNHDYDRSVRKIVCRAPGNWGDVRFDALLEALGEVIDLRRLALTPEECRRRRNR
jgi:hypothetical protein